MSSKTRATSSRTLKSEARDAYVSFNRDEWTALQKLGFRERWAYMQLKWLANFKTGMVGNFRKQDLTYQDIANLVTAPGVQGRGTGNIDDTQAPDFLRRMAAVGLLVQHPNRANGGLLVELPLSPINRKASVLTSRSSIENPDQGDGQEVNSPAKPLPKVAISPDDDIPPFDESPANTWVSDEPTPSLSVLALTTLKNNTDGERSANADAAPPSRATGAAADRGFPRPNATWVAALTPKAIQAALSHNWDWQGMETSEAWTLYEVWSRAGITADILFQAVTTLEADWSPEKVACTPADLVPVLAMLLPESRLAA